MTKEILLSSTSDGGVDTAQHTGIKRMGFFKTIMVTNSTSTLVFMRPSGIECTGDFLRVADSGNGRIQKFSLGGGYIDTLGEKGSGDGQFSWDRDVAANSNSIFVADTGNSRIQKFDLDGNFISKWGSYGSGNGQFRSPWGITCNDSYVWVADYVNQRIQKFDLNGTFIASWGGYKEVTGVTNNSDSIWIAYRYGVRKVDLNGTTIFQISYPETLWPYDVALNSNYAFVTDSPGYIKIRVSKFDLDGNFIASWGSRGYGDGEFEFLRGITCNDSYVWVADENGYYNARVQKFDLDGNFISKWGVPGTV